MVRLSRQFRALCAAALIVGGACAGFAQQSEAEAQADPQVQDYSLFVAAQTLDNRCQVLDYPLRALLNDMVFGSMLRLPGVAGTSSADMGYEAYYANIDKVAAPISERARAEAGAIDCAMAEQAVGGVKLTLLSELFAHAHLSGGQFDTMANDQEKTIYRSTLQAVQRGLAGQPESTLNGYVGQRVQRSNLSGEKAANRARYIIDLLMMGSVLNRNGYELRWNEEAKGWNFLEMRSKMVFKSNVMGDPRVIQMHMPKDTGYNRSYELKGRVLILPRRGETLRFFLLPVDRETNLFKASARVQAGTGKANVGFLVPTVDYASGEVKVTYDRAGNCLISMFCAGFPADVSAAMKQRWNNGKDNFSMQFVLTSEDADKRDGPAEIRRRTLPDRPRPYLPNLSHIFTKAQQ